MRQPFFGGTKHLGSIEAGKRADLIVIEERSSDPYSAVIRATEESLRLVVINGVARYGTPELVKSMGVVNGGETLTVGGRSARFVWTRTRKTPISVLCHSAMRQPL